jgi:hypothetical protein
MHFAPLFLRILMAKRGTYNHQHQHISIDNVEELVALLGEVPDVVTEGLDKLLRSHEFLETSGALELLMKTFLKCDQF